MKTIVTQLIILCTLMSLQLARGQTHIIEGRLSRQDTRDILANATIQVIKPKIAQTFRSNAQGYFSLTIPSDSIQESFIRINIIPAETTFNLQYDLNINHQGDLPISIPEAMLPIESSEPDTKPAQSNSVQEISERPADSEKEAAIAEPPQDSSNFELEALEPPSPDDKMEQNINEVMDIITETKGELKAVETSVEKQSQTINQVIDNIYQDLRQNSAEITQERKDKLLQDLIVIEKELRELKMLFQIKKADYQQLLVDTEKKITEIRKLLGQSTSQHYTQITFGVLLAILLLALTVLGAYFIIRKIKRRQKELAQQKKDLEALTKQYAQAVHHREILIKEIHHRVKNNLQLVISLFRLQARNIKDEKALAIIKDGQDRIYSMALAHEQLHKSFNPEQLDFKEYISELVDNIAETFSSEKQIDYHISGNAPFLDIDTSLSLGLIINELITNAYKYAFQKQDKGNIWIAIKHEDEHYQLSISDDGQGLPPNFSIEKVKSLGLKIVRMLANELKGSIRVKQEPRTEFLIEF